MKKFLLIEHGGPRKTFTIKALKDKKLDVYIACSTIPEWLTKLINKNKIIVTDTFNSTKLLTDIVSFIESNNINFDAIGTFYEHVVTQTADIAKALNLIGIDPGAARKSSNNKLLMRKICKDAGLPTPKYLIIKNPDNKSIRKAIEKIKLPCVIKPIFGAESFGTIKIANLSEIDSVLSYIKATTSSKSKEVFKNFENNFLLEEYLEGDVVSVDGIVQNLNIHIAGMVEFVMGPEPRFTQEANYIPPRLNKDIQEQCKEITKKYIKALGFDNCGFHCELRVTKKGPVLIEIAARLPGGPLQPGYKKAYEIDLTSKLIDLWLGNKVVIEQNKPIHILQKAVFPNKSIKIKDLKGIHKTKKMQNVWALEKITQENEEILLQDQTIKPLYYYAISAESFEKLNEIQKEVENNIELTIKY